MSNHQEAHRHALLLRLRKVEGQIRGIQKMINDEQACESIAQQMAAARKALDRAFFEMTACLLQQSAGEDPAKQDEHAKIADLLRKYG